MAYQIMRVKKLKTAGNVKTSLEHLKRENNRAPNADLNRTRLNDDSHSNSDAAMRKFEQIGRDLYMQSNSVQALEYLVTASPDAFKSEDEWHNYLVDSYEWIKEKHGEENIFFYSLQYDETTPHMSVLVRPISERKFKNGRTQKSLSAKKFMDGGAKLSQMQTDFNQAVGKKHNLARGEKKSTATHKQIKSWYSEKKAESTSSQTAHDLINRLEKIILRLRKEQRRWRKIAREVAENWFNEDLEKINEVSGLVELENEVKESEVLSRGVKRDLSININRKINSLTPTKVKKRRL